MLSGAVTGLLASLGLDLVTVGLIVIGIVALELGFGVISGMIKAAGSYSESQRKAAQFKRWDERAEWKASRKGRF